jgi:hypothetical protein
MKRILITVKLLILFLFVNAGTEFCIAAKEGYLTDKYRNITYELKCPNPLDSISKKCFYELNIPAGIYNYRSKDGDDTANFILTTEEPILIRSTENFSIIK